MKQINKASYSDHQELSQLLPWYVNKTLQGTELKAVEDHLKVCLMCKREQTQLQKLAQVIAHNGSIDTAEHASFSRLKKRLHNGQDLDLQAPIKQGTSVQNISGNVKPLRADKKQFWSANIISRPALAMAAALLLSLTVLMPHYIESDKQLIGNFRTLSSDSQLQAMKSNEIRVVFADNVNQQQKDKILEKVHGQFIDNNPTAQGVYTVRLEKNVAENHLLDAIDLLRKDKNVIFAEPAYALLSSTQAED
ncbi:MAG: hypothetical protein IPN42_14695 [Methylococcaceae bacterium]|nr:hypothetical protein [Methylococcaceae bacterium]